MGNRLLEGRAAQGLIARLAPPFDREVVEAGLGEMVCDGFGLGRRAYGFVPEDFARSAVERLAAALEKTVVGRVLDERVLEAIGCLRAGALDEQEVGVDKAIERGLQGGVAVAALAERGLDAVIDRGYSMEQGIGEIASQHRADLRDFARRPKPVEPRRERLLKRRRDRLQAAGFAALNEKASDLLNE
jgi:hypothetical protein